ncbi:MAG: SprB repeat-containing protein, partial [Salibacteraceae bacterium]
MLFICTALGLNNVQAAPGCKNVTNAGQIGNTQSNCGPFDPSAITNLSNPSGGRGALEIIWLKRQPGQSYSVIPGATGLTYDPPTLSQTMQYRRCARRSGCSAFTGESNWITITVLLEANVSVQVDQMVTCAGESDGGATAMGSGVAPFSYLWSNGATTASASNLSVGQYSVTVTDNNGCTAVESVQITEPSAIQLSINVADASCNGSDGSISATPNGGSSPYNYIWSNGVTVTGQNNLTPGTYAVTVSDANGCTAVGSGDVLVPTCCNVISAGTIGNDQSNCGPLDPAPINSLSLPGGGLGAIEYVWLQSPVNVPNVVGNPNWTLIAGATGASYDPGMLSQTTYFIRCARRSGCSFYAGESNIIEVKVFDAATVSATVDNNVSCAGGVDGSATASATGTAP